MQIDRAFFWLFLFVVNIVNILNLFHIVDTMQIVHLVYVLYVVIVDLNKHFVVVMVVKMVVVDHFVENEYDELHNYGLVVAVKDHTILKQILSHK